MAVEAVTPEVEKWIKGAIGKARKRRYDEMANNDAMAFLGILIVVVLFLLPLMLFR